jgi:hypothetical protein
MRDNVALAIAADLEKSFGGWKMPASDLVSTRSSCGKLWTSRSHTDIAARLGPASNPSYQSSS